MSTRKPGDRPSKGETLPGLGGAPKPRAEGPGKRPEGLAVTPSGNTIDAIGGVPLPRRRGERPVRPEVTPIEEIEAAVADDPGSSTERRLGAIVSEAEAKPTPKRPRATGRVGADLRGPLAAVIVVGALAAAFVPPALEARARAAQVTHVEVVKAEAKRIGAAHPQLAQWLAARDLSAMARVQTAEQPAVADAAQAAGLEVTPENVSLRADFDAKVLTLRVEVPALEALATATTDGTLRGPEPPPAGFGAVLGEQLAWVLSILLVGAFLAGLPWLVPALRARL